MLPSRKAKEPKVKRPKPPSLEDLASCSQHCVVFGATRIKCLGCFASVSLNSVSARTWLSSACVSEDSRKHVFRYRPINVTGICVGSQAIHHTHKVTLYRGLLFCIRCGGRGPTCLRKLSTFCRPATRAGIAVKDALERGNLPPGMDAWPA